MKSIKYLILVASFLGGTVTAERLTNDAVQMYAHNPVALINWCEQQLPAREMGADVFALAEADVVDALRRVAPLLPEPMGVWHTLNVRDIATDAAHIFLLIGWCQRYSDDVNGIIAAIGNVVDHIDRVEAARRGEYSNNDRAWMPVL